jgi:hypothetical protein
MYDSPARHSSNSRATPLPSTVLSGHQTDGVYWPPAATIVSFSSGISSTNRMPPLFLLPLRIPEHQQLRLSAVRLPLGNVTTKFLISAGPHKAEPTHLGTHGNGLEFAADAVSGVYLYKGRTPESQETLQNINRREEKSSARRVATFFLFYSHPCLSIIIIVGSCVSSYPTMH